MRQRLMRRTSDIATKCEWAWTPEPSIARLQASTRARKSVATPETAAVRMAVIAEALIMASSSPVSALKSSTPPWCAVHPYLELDFHGIRILLLTQRQQHP